MHDEVDKIIDGGETMVGSWIVHDISFPPDTAEAVGARAFSDYEGPFTADDISEHVTETDGQYELEAHRLQKQSDDYEARCRANAAMRGNRILSFLRLSRGRPVFLRTTVPYQQFPPDPRYDEMLARIAARDGQDVNTIENNAIDWDAPVIPISDKVDPQSTPLINYDSKFEQHENVVATKRHNFFAKIGENIQHRRPAVALGALILAGSVLFAATSINGKDPVRNQLPNTERQVTPPRVSGGNGFPMPTDVLAPIRIAPISPVIVNENPGNTSKLTTPEQSNNAETTPTAPQENSQILTAVVTPGGNLPWAIKDQLATFISDPRTLDVVADTLTEELQASTGRDLGTVYAGDSFDISTNHVRELLGLDLNN